VATGIERRQGERVGRQEEETRQTERVERLKVERQEVERREEVCKEGGRGGWTRGWTRHSLRSVQV